MKGKAVQQPEEQARTQGGQMHCIWHYCCWLIVMAALLIWWLLPGTAASVLFIPMWVVVAQLIFAGSLEAARLQRRAWLGQYLRMASPLHRWLRGGAVMMIWHQLLGFALALALLVSLRQLDSTDWPLLLLALGLFIASGRWLRKRLDKHVISDFLPAVTRKLSVPPVASLLALGLMLMALWRPQPNLINVRWETALRDHVVAGAGQTLLGAMERMASALELTGLWAMQNAMVSLDVNGPVAILGWGILLLMQGAFAWSFVRLMAGVTTLSHRLLGDSRCEKLIQIPSRNS